MEMSTPLGPKEITAYLHWHSWALNGELICPLDLDQHQHFRDLWAYACDALDAKSTASGNDRVELARKLLGGVSAVFSKSCQQSGGTSRGGGGDDPQLVHHSARTFVWRLLGRLSSGRFDTFAQVLCAALLEPGSSWIQMSPDYNSVKLQMLAGDVCSVLLGEKIEGMEEQGNRLQDIFVENLAKGRKMPSVTEMVGRS